VNILLLAALVVFIVVAVLAFLTTVTVATLIGFTAIGLACMVAGSLYTGWSVR
jgi:1,4-dihydroxy-2-naphthoate octaprenyltransferase